MKGCKGYLSGSGQWDCNMVYYYCKEKLKG